MIGAAARVRRALRQLGALHDYRAVFSTPAGRRVLDDILVSNHFLATTTEPGDPGLSAHREGERAAALEILRKARLTARDLEAQRERIISERDDDD